MTDTISPLLDQIRTTLGKIRDMTSTFVDCIPDNQAESLKALLMEYRDSADKCLMLILTPRTETDGFQAELDVIQKDADEICSQLETFPTPKCFEDNGCGASGEIVCDDGQITMDDGTMMSLKGMTFTIEEL